MRHGKQGFTLIELLVALALGVGVLTIAFNTFAGNSRLVETDTGRVMGNQNVQTAVDLMAADVRQAGENLELDLGISGLEFDNAAQTLTVRRSIPPLTAAQAASAPDLVGQLLQRLPICAKTATTIQVVGPPPGSTTATSACTYNAGPGNEDVKIRPWRAYFTSQEGRPQAALLYRPASGSTSALIQKTVVTVVEPTTGTAPTQRVNVTLGAPVPAAFTSTNGSLLILIDERRYQRVGNELRMALGGQTADQAQTVAFDVTNLKVSATLAATDTAPQETVTSLALNGPWVRVRQVALELSAGSAGQGRGGARTYSTQIFPRNVESARKVGAGAP